MTTPTQPATLAPLPRLLLSLQNQDWSVAGALAEPTDNALADDKGDAQNVSIVIRKDALGVLDDGYGTDNINRLFQIGNHGPSRAGKSAGIGLYGVGVTDASVFLANRLHVISVYEGWRHEHTVDWQRCLDEDRWEPPYQGQGRAALPGEQGTQVWFEQTRQTANAESLAGLLAELYAPALRGGRRIEIHDERPKMAVIRQVQAAQPPVELASISGSVETPSDVLHWTGGAGIVAADQTLSHAQNHVHIGFGHRIIEHTRDAFGNRNASGVYVYVDLGQGWQHMLNAHKDRITRYRAPLMASITSQIEHLLAQAQEQARTLQVRTIAVGLGQVLTRAANNKGTTGQPGSATGKPGDGVGPTGEPHVHTTNKKTQHQTPGQEVLPDPNGKGIAPGEGTSGKLKTGLGEIEVEFKPASYFARPMSIGLADINGRAVVYLNNEHALIKQVFATDQWDALKVAAANLFARRWAEAWHSADQHVISRLPLARRTMLASPTQDFATAQEVAADVLLAGMTYGDKAPAPGRAAGRRVVGGFVTGQEVVIRKRDPKTKQDGYYLATVIGDNASPSKGGLLNVRIAPNQGIAVSPRSASVGLSRVWSIEDAPVQPAALAAASEEVAS